MTRKALSDNQLQEIIALYKQGIPPKEIGERFGIRNNSVTRILRKKGIARNQAAPKVSEENQKLIMEKYLAGISSEKIAEELDINGTTVCRILKRNGVEIRPATENKRKYELNHDFFNDIHTEEFSYFYGFMVSDGSVHSSRNQITIGLNPKDIDILRKLSFLIYKKDLVKIYENEIKLGIYSKDIRNRLIELGCSPNKTFVINFPEWLKAENYRHFIRGLIDGDGGLYSAPIKISLTGNENITQKVKDIINKELDIESNHYPYKDSFNIEITGINKVKRLSDWLYSNSKISLNRKNHAKNLIHIERKIENKPRNYGTDFIPSYSEIILTKNNLEKIPISEREKIADFIFDFYRNNGFPFARQEHQSLITDYNNLIMFKSKNIIRRDYYILNNSETGIKFFKHFAKNYYYTRSKNRPSMVEAFNNDDTLLKVIKNRLGITYKEVFNIHGNMIKQGLRNSYLAFAASIFKPTVAKYIYETYAPKNGSVFDFSMGFGQRMLAANSLGLTYIGCDPWHETIINLNKQKEFLTKLNNSTISINEICSSKFCPTKLIGKIDLAFSSPPYYNTEIYSNDQSQAYNNGYQSFVDWWDKTIENTKKLLKQNGILSINLPDNETTQDMLNIINKYHFNEVKRYFIKMNRNNKFTSNNKYEFVFIFKSK